MNFLLNPRAGLTGSRILPLCCAASGSGYLRGLRYLLRLHLVRYLHRLRHLRRSRCFRYLRRSRHHRLRGLRRSRLPGKNAVLKNAVLKKKRLYRIGGTVACSYSYFFGVTVPRMLKTILSGVPLVDTVIDLAMPPMRLVS